MKENSTKLAETANNGCDLSRSNSSNSNTFRFLLLQCTHVVLYLLHTWLGKACHAKYAGGLTGKSKVKMFSILSKNVGW